MEYDVEFVTDYLKDFFGDNQSSRVDTIEDNVSEHDNDGEQEPGHLITITDPWGDSSLGVILPRDLDSLQELLDSLNYLVLPNEFSGILHKDTRKMEIIWTPYKLRESAREISGRSFNFNFQGNIHRCSFGPSSERLLLIAKHIIPVTQAGSSDYRNILPFHMFANDMDLPRLDKPLSFWIDCAGIEPIKFTELFQHLNAYMTYFDAKSPQIIIHEQVSGNAFNSRSRYIRERFPTSITGKQIDPNVLSFWCQMTRTSDVIMRYLLCYRVIEYCSFNYIDRSTKMRVKRIVGAADAADKLDRVVDEVTEVFATTKELADIKKMQNMMEDLLDMKLIWEEILKNKNLFYGETEFDGGFKIKPLISKNCEYENWASNSVRTTMDRLREIRNALSHGQDGATRGTIQSTVNNSSKLRAWLSIIEIIAGEVMLMRNTV